HADQFEETAVDDIDRPVGQAIVAVGERHIRTGIGARIPAAGQAAALRGRGVDPYIHTGAVAVAVDVRASDLGVCPGRDVLLPIVGGVEPVRGGGGVVVGQSDLCGVDQPGD